jgi:hypothetical protein
MKPIEPPLQHIFALGNLSLAGVVVAVEADAEERVGLAQWAGVDSVERFAGTVTLRRLSQMRFSYEADLTADVTQTCVVTLEPVAGHIDRQITRELHLAPRVPTDLLQSSGELTLSAGDDDVPETLTSLDYDIAAPLLEEFVLAIDPYPRKGEVAFAAPTEPEVPQSSPFAALKALKDRG